LKKPLAFSGAFLLVCVTLFAKSPFEQGESLFMNNKPREAAPFLETAVAANPDNIKAALYLGLAYQQLNRLDEAIAVYLHVLPKAGPDTAVIAYNLGNLYFAKGNLKEAESCYNKSLTADSAYSSACLNRANTRVRLGEYRGALEDYNTYLSLEPGSSKRSQVEQIVAKIQGKLAADERKRIQEEAAKAAAAERKKKLLEDVNNSLQNAAGETKGVSTGSEKVRSYEDKVELQ
jgi:tetratricopeptide (TPR) repeat protein